MLRALIMVSWLAFVAACGDVVNRGGEPDPAPAPEAPPAETETAPAEAAPEPFEPAARPSVRPESARIDWPAARRDLAERPADAETANFGIESGGSAPPVPVLLPTGIVTPQGAGQPAYRPLNDGYYANYPGTDYDITVSGTNRVYGSAEGAEDTAGMSFERMAAGAQVSLSRYGADYLVEFECKGYAGARGDNCVSEEDALQIARDLVIAGTR